MDPAYITPFVASVQNVFSTMLQLPVRVGEPRAKQGRDPTHDVSGVIGMSGDVTGSVVLSFPRETAERVVALFGGTRVEAGSADFADAVGELVNMISGGAKAQFPDDRRVTIGCPSVVIGAGHTVSSQSDAPCVLIPCETDCGEMVIEVAIVQTRDARRAA